MAGEKAPNISLDLRWPLLKFSRLGQGVPCNGYDLMVEFAETIEDELLREKLSIALDGRGVFRRFKNVIAD